MASTYEITDQGGYTEVLLKEDSTVINRFAISKKSSIRVRNGLLEIYDGNRLTTPRIPRTLIAIPASADDEELFNNLSFMSSVNSDLQGWDYVFELESLPAGTTYNTGIFLDLNVDAGHYVEAKAIAVDPNGPLISRTTSSVVCRVLGDGSNPISSVNVVPDNTTANFAGTPQNFIQPFIAINQINYRVQPSTLTLKWKLFIKHDKYEI